MRGEFALTSYFSERRLARAVLMVVGFGLLFSAGFYRQSLAGESGSFAVRFPAPGGPGTGGSGMGGPMGSGGHDGHEGHGGGAMNRGVTVDLGAQGLPKRVLQPWTVNVRSHQIVNASTKPYTLRFEMVDCPLPVQWDAHDMAWNERTRTLDRPVRPGERVGLNLNFSIPPELRRDPVVYQGGLKILDKETGGTLAFVPIRIKNSRAQSHSSANPASREGH